MHELNTSSEGPSPVPRVRAMDFTASANGVALSANGVAFLEPPSQAEERSSMPRMPAMPFAQKGNLVRDSFRRLRSQYERRTRVLRMPAMESTCFSNMPVLTSNISAKSPGRRMPVMAFATGLQATRLDAAQRTGFEFQSKIEQGEFLFEEPYEEPNQESYQDKIQSLVNPHDAQFDRRIYSPLSFHDSLRLVEIIPGIDAMPIAPRLHHVRLGDQPRYDALSYVWGRKELQSQSHQVTLNNNVVDVTPNLFHALKRLRLQDRSTIIWVDMLSINQSDNDEKEKQVRLMSQIYKTASRVLVWLGTDETSMSNSAFRLVCEVVNYHTTSSMASFVSSNTIEAGYVPHSLPESTSNQWRFLENLFGMEWFWRVWIIQEIALSNSAYLMWGHSMIEWSWVGLAAACIRLRMSDLFERHFLPGIFNAYFMYRISIASETIFKPVTLSFLRLLAMTQQYYATDPRDRVYGLLGLPSPHLDQDGRLFIEPNYNLSVDDVYRAVALKIIEVEGNLSLLSSVQHGLELCPSLESWVPRWDKAPFTKSLLSGDHTHHHKADGGIPMDRSLLGDQHRLVVRGLQVGTVETLFHPMDDNDFRLEDRPWGYDGICKCCNQLPLLNLHASEDRVLLSLTLTAGKDWYGLLVENEETHVADFAAWTVAGLEGHISGPYPEQSSADMTASTISTAQDKANTAFGQEEVSTRSSPSLPHIHAAHNDQQDFIFFPRTKQKATNCTPSGIQPHSNSCIYGQAHQFDPTIRSLTSRGSTSRFAEAAKSASNGRRLFFTNDGRLGLGPAAMEKGDRVCILFGGSVLFILRPEGQSWRLVGECYVNALMNGQGVDEAGIENAKWFDIR